MEPRLDLVGARIGKKGSKSDNFFSLKLAQKHITPHEEESTVSTKNTYFSFDPAVSLLRIHPTQPPT